VDAQTSGHNVCTFVDAYQKSTCWPGEIQHYGGDTIWRTTAAAYLDLPEPLREAPPTSAGGRFTAMPMTNAVKNVGDRGGPGAFEEGSRGTDLRNTSIRWCASIPRTGERHSCSAILSSACRSSEI